MDGWVDGCDVWLHATQSRSISSRYLTLGTKEYIRAGELAQVEGTS